MVESLGRNIEVKVSFTDYRGFALPTAGTGYLIDSVVRTPADTTPETKIRAGGDVAFTVRLAGEYSTFSKLTVNGYDYSKIRIAVKAE